MAVKQSDNIKLAIISEKMNNIENTVNELKQKLNDDYSTNDEIELKCGRMARDVEFLQKIVFGLISLILVTVIGGLVTWFINSPK